jgi:hypothetical protein
VPAGPPLQLTIQSPGMEVRVPSFGWKELEPSRVT